MDIAEIRLRTEEIIGRLHQLTIKQDNICSATNSDNQAYSDLTELGELHNKTEALRQQLKSLKYRSRIDDEVLEIERKLDDALNRYFWLWQKCKSNLHTEQEHH